VEGEEGMRSGVFVGKCLCGMHYENDYGHGCSEHRDKMKKANAEKMTKLRAKRGKT
jgi:hypothetical protein